MNLTVGDTFTDPGATAVDNIDGSVVVVASGSIDTSTAGTYTITYTAKDAANNSASATRTVNVKSVQLPADVCANIEGNQVSIPEGYHQDGNNCNVDEIVQDPPPTADNTGGGSRSGGHHHPIGGGEVLGASTSIYGGSLSGGTDLQQKLLAIMMQFLDLLQKYQANLH
jgi:hypothetical protein